MMKDLQNLLTRKLGDRLCKSLGRRVGAADHQDNAVLAQAAIRNNERKDFCDGGLTKIGSDISLVGGGGCAKQKKRFNSGIARIWGGVYPCPHFLHCFFIM